MRQPRRCDILVELALGRLGHAGDGRIQRHAGKVAQGASVNLIVDVGDVAGIEDMICPIDAPQQAEQHVEDDDRPRIADMGEIIDRRAADIEPHRLRVERNEVVLGSGQRVEEA